MKTELPGTYETQQPGIAANSWKKTDLTGVYNMQSPTTGSGHMQVSCISSCCLQFTTPGSHTIEVGDQTSIVFTLNDRKQTEINKRVIVQSISGNIVGCQFAGNETHTKHDEL